MRSSTIGCARAASNALAICILLPAAFSLHELTPLRRVRTFTALSWHCSFLCLSLPTETHTRGGVFLARAHLLALPPHRLRSFATFFSPRFSLRRFPCTNSFSLRRFPCTNSSHCTELASSPLFHGIALFLCLCLPTEAHTHGGVFLARTHPIAPSSHLHRSFMALLFFSASACLRRLTPMATFSLHELIPLHRVRIFTALSWHCSFNNLFLSAAWFACGHSHSMVAGGFPVMS